MTVGTAFIRGANPVWSYVDLNGIQFDDTYWLWTLTNQIPYIPQAVYQDPGGTMPWTDPVQFQGNGTLPNNLYWNDTQVYRLEIRQHVGLGPPTQADPLIYLVENYIPNGTGVVPGTTEGIVTDNQISNPQFAVVNFASPLTLTSTIGLGPIEIAPDWFLQLYGPGTATITQVPLNTTIPTPTNAPYALQIELTGAWTSEPVLRQRFQQNGQNWQNQYAASSITAMMIGSGPTRLTMRLEASSGNTIALLQQPVLNNNFVQYTNNTIINSFANLNLPPAAYIQHSIYFPYNCNVYLTSLQLVISDSNQNYAYQQSTVDRQMDNLSHYYVPQLIYKPIPSYLVGWDFKTNPSQNTGVNLAVAQNLGNNSSYYTWDQTILFQSLTSAFTIARGTTGQTAGSFQVTAAVASPQFALVQYLDTRQTLELLSGFMSVGVQGTASTSGGLTGKITLWATTGSVPIITGAGYPSVVASLDATGFPTVQSGWTQIPNIRVTDPTFVLNSSLETQYFNGWTLNGAAPTATATYFAIVIGFTPMASGDIANFNWISLCSGFIATQPAPKTINETLSDCEFFYEKSYAANIAPGTVSQQNAMTGAAGTFISGGNSALSLSSFSLKYRTLKRSLTPKLTTYPASVGTANAMDAYITQGVTGTTGLVYVANTGTPTYNYVIGNKTVLFNPANAPAINVGNTNLGAGFIIYHYVIDARLGVV